MAISLLAYLATFSGQLHFRKSYFFTLPQSNYFDTTVNFRGAISSERLLSMRSSDFGTVTSTHQFFLQSFYFFGAKLLPSNGFFRIGSSLRKLLFGTANFGVKELPKIKITREKLSFFWKKLIFQKRNIPHFLLFQES